MRRVSVTAVAASCVLLAGCGVPPTDLVDAGEPAGGVIAPAPYVYFLLDGQLRPVPIVGAADDAASSLPTPPGVLPGSDDSAVLVGLSLLALAAGPSSAQLAAGMSTELGPGLSFEVTSLSADAVVITVRPPGTELVASAFSQIGCTVISALSTTETAFAGHVSVSRGPGLPYTEAPCAPDDLEALPFSA